MNWSIIFLTLIFRLSLKSWKNWFFLSSLTISRFQSAYLPGHSTDTALLKIVSDFLLALDDENVSLLALLDVSTDFDTIDHSILLYRLHYNLEYNARPQTGFHPT